MSDHVVRPMTPEDVAAVVSLQRLAFPPPIFDDLHWNPRHLQHHIMIFPEGQMVAESDGETIGSCGNARISEERWQRHQCWGQTVGGPYIQAYDPNGSTLYGLDKALHTDRRRLGIGRGFYAARFNFIRSHGLVRYGAGCRVPDCKAYASSHQNVDVQEYVDRVVKGDVIDRTLTPLLRYGLSFVKVVRDYMPNEESSNTAALLEWRP